MNKNGQSTTAQHYCATCETWIIGDKRWAKHPESAGHKAAKKRQLFGPARAKAAGR